MSLIKKRLDELVKWTLADLTPGLDDKRVELIKARLPALIKAAEEAATTDDKKREALRSAPAKTEKDRKKLILLLLRLLGTPLIEAAWNEMPPGERKPKPLRPGIDVLQSSTRLAAEIAHPDPADAQVLADWLKKGKPEMAEYRAERRGLPAGFDVETFVDAVAAQLAELNFPRDQFPAFHAVVVGKLLLQGHADPQRSDFSHALRRAYVEGIASTKATRTNGAEPQAIKNYVTYGKVADDIAAVRGDDPIRYQELASVADYVVAGADNWPVDDDATRRLQVEIGLTRYVDGSAETGFSALSLPPVVSEDASQQEIEPANVEAVAMIAAAAEIEQSLAPDVVERIHYLWTYGLVPVSGDEGGRALDRWHWSSEDRLDAAARAEQYARAVGYVGGGGAPSDVQPNIAFSEHRLRCASSLARYDSDMRIANVVALDRRETSGTSEYVRKACHDWAANASLYGWGFTIFAARRLKRQIDQVFEVLGQESLQRAYGVTGPWQLVERVAALELQAMPNVVVHRTVAKATKDMLDILARYATELSVSGSNGRFLPSAAEVATGQTGPGTTVSIEDYEALVGAANNLLAVSGTSEEEVYRMAQPARSVQGPSIPTVGGGGPAAGSDAVLSQISQLVAQGQAPSLEQLQRLGLGVGA